MPADVLLDVSSIELKDGDVTITDDLLVSGGTTLNGSLSIAKAANSDAILIIDSATSQVRLRIETDGEIRVFHTNGYEAVKINTGGVYLKNTSNATKASIQTSGAAYLYGDLTMVGSDIKLDGQFLANRLDSIEARLTAGGL